jgi:PhnB protein
MSVKPIPDGYPTASSCIIVKGAAAAIAFYKKILGATEKMVMTIPGGGPVVHAELNIGDSLIMLADEMPQMGVVAPAPSPTYSASICVYVKDVDATFAAALAAGGKSLRPLQTHFYGDRSGTFIDPFGHVWTLATHVEDVTPEEMDKRFHAEMKKHAAG